MRIYKIDISFLYMLFGGGTTTTTTQPSSFLPMNPNPTPTFPQASTTQTIKIDDKNIPAIWGDQLKQMLQGYHQLTWDIHLKNLLYLVDMQQQQSLQTMQKAKTTDFTKKIWDTKSNKQKVEYVRDRCNKIQQKNTSLLIKLMNLRQKMVSQMYMYKVSSKSRSMEMSQISQKIRDLKYQISLKYNKLKMVKLSKEQEEVKEEKKKKPLIINVPLVELKKGVEILEKETMKMQEEFKLVQGHIHGENVL